jgi:hypothetical protein
MRLGQRPSPSEGKIAARNDTRNDAMTHKNAAGDGGVRYLCTFHFLFSIHILSLFAGVHGVQPFRFIHQHVDL